MNFSKSSKLTRVSDAVAPGTSDISSTAVDMQGFDAATFLVAFGAIVAGAVTSIKLQGSTDGSTWTTPGGDLENSAVAVADDDDNQIFALDVSNPRFRYLRCVVDRATQNATIDAIIAIQHASGGEPVTQPATTTVEYNHAPAVGVA